MKSLIALLLVTSFSAFAQVQIEVKSGRIDYSGENLELNIAYDGNNTPVFELHVGKCIGFDKLKCNFALINKNKPKAYGRGYRRTETYSFDLEVIRKQIHGSRNDYTRDHNTTIVIYDDARRGGSKYPSALEITLP